MVRTLNEMSEELKEFIVKAQNDAHNQRGFNQHRYNNLKVEVPSKGLSSSPILKITIGISEAIFDLATLEKVSGSLGPDERYVYLWINRDAVQEKLRGILSEVKKGVDD